MAFFCSVMLDISLELAAINPQTYDEVVSKFFDHFISLCDTINNVGGKDNGLWNEEDGFYYDRIRLVKYVPVFLYGLRYKRGGLLFIIKTL